MRGVIPEGYRPGLPLVQVSPSMIERHGDPVVNYEGLEDLYHGHFGVPIKKEVRINLKKLRGEAAGHFNPWKRVIDVDPTTTYQYYSQDDGLTEVLLHEGQHLSDSFHRALSFYGETALAFAVPLGGAGIGALLGAEASDIAKLASKWAPLAIAGASFAGSMPAGRFVGGYMYNHSPGERRARETEHDFGLLERYRGVIDFPEQQRLAEAMVF